MIYLETSALVKLIRIELESAALGDWLDEHSELRWITSVLTEVELPRAIRAVAPEGLPAVPSVLARLDRFEIDSVIRSTAAAYPNAALRSLDAIHLICREHCQEGKVRRRRGATQAAPRCFLGQSVW